MCNSPQMRSSPTTVTMEVPASTVQGSRSFSTILIATPAASTHTEGTDAFSELLLLEREYAKALALICDIHIPLAEGMPSPTTVSRIFLSGPSVPLRSTSSNSSANPQQHGPLMTSEDVAIVFRNIRKIANFSSQLVQRLETACYGANRQNEVGELFLEIIPQLKILYKAYLMAQPAALARLEWLFNKTSNRAPHFNTLNSVPYGTPDLFALLAKPAMQVSLYSHLLKSVDASLVRHKDSGAPLTRARELMDEVGKELEIGRMANELPQLGVRLYAYPSFLDELAERIKSWGVETHRSLKLLQRWAITFSGAVFGFSLSPSSPHPCGYEAFLSLLSSLSRLCVSLQDDIKLVFKHLHKLKEMTKNPRHLFQEMHALHTSRSFPRSRRRYLLLRDQLSSQLPRLLGAMDRAVALTTGMITEEYFKPIKEKWINFFNSMVEEGEQDGGMEEVSRAWKMRWELGLQEHLIWNRISMLGEPRPSTGSQVSLPVGVSLAAAEQPSINGVASVPAVSSPKLRMRFSFPPSSRPSSRMRQSVAGSPPALYTIRVHEPYNPPPHCPYRDFSFFDLTIGDSFEVLEEGDHPLAHKDLPQHFVSKKGEDCLLKVRATSRGRGYDAGDVGWVLARFVSAD